MWECIECDVLSRYTGDIRGNTMFTVCFARILCAYMDEEENGESVFSELLN